MVTVITYVLRIYVLEKQLNHNITVGEDMLLIELTAFVIKRFILLLICTLMQKRKLYLR